MMTKEEIRQRSDEAFTARRTNAFLYACAVEKEDKKAYNIYINGAINLLQKRRDMLLEISEDLKK